MSPLPNERPGQTPSTPFTPERSPHLCLLQELLVLLPQLVQLFIHLLRSLTSSVIDLGDRAKDIEASHQLPVDFVFKHKWQVARMKFVGGFSRWKVLT